MFVFSIAYLPTIEYVSAFLQADSAYIERCENYRKQTYRNRCLIPTANGIQSLCIPVTKQGLHACTIDQIRIDYRQPWQRAHFKAIATAYNASPFFLYYRDYFESFYLQEHILTLFDFNMQLFRLLLRLFGIEKTARFTSEYVSSYNEPDRDLRQLIQPKTRREDSSFYHSPTSYRQVFADKCGFIPNMSCIDLLFNEGKMAPSYLRKYSAKLCR
jgi:hypothetical protein